MSMSAPTHDHPVLQAVPDSRAVTDSAVGDSTVGDSTVVDSSAGDNLAGEPDHELARSEAEALWAALARARSIGEPRVIASAEDAVFRFYLPLAHALAAGAATRRRTDPTGSVHAATRANPCAYAE